MEDRFKFKVYDKKRKKLLGKEHASQRFWLDNDGNLTEDDYDCYMSEPWNLPDLVICMSTGLKDRNGKLIYEGDLLKKASKYSGNSPIIAPVEWSGGEWEAFKHVRKFFKWYEFEEAEIVGNIYEHSHLLEGK